MSNSQAAPGVVGPFAGLDVPWLLRLRAETRGDHPFLIWAPFDAPARIWRYGEFHDRVGALAAGLARRGVKSGEFVLIHLDNCIEALLAWFACVELGAIAVTTNTRSAPAEMEYFAGHCGAVAAITQPAYAEMIAAHCRGLRWLAVISHDAGARPAQGTAAPRGDAFDTLFARMKLRPEEITSILRKRIEEFDVETNLAEVGTVFRSATASPACTGSRTAWRSRCSSSTTGSSASRSTSRRTTSASRCSASGTRSSEGDPVRRTGKVARSRSARPCSAASSTRSATRSTARARSRRPRRARSSSRRRASSSASP